MNKRILLSIILLGIMLLSGCVNMGTKENPLDESLSKRADGSYIGVISSRPSIDSSVSVVTLYEKDEETGKFTAIETSKPHFTPTVAGQTIAGAVTGFASSTPIGLGLGVGQAVNASAAKSVANTQARVARYGIDASKDAAPSTIFNLMSNSSPVTVSGAESNSATTNDIGVGLSSGEILFADDWLK